ncbi:MAG TPA: LD-carboxypeptidase [Chitinophagaceae bacterium]|nr:LD-carboxypeptidase [Chitinophagaceae bacterium]
MTIIPPYLQPGDTIGIVCPAGYMPEEKAQTCINTLQEWGYNVKIGFTVGGNSENYFSGTDEERLYDLQQMLDDDMVQAVMCGRGGYGTGRIIELVDFKKFSKHPKWIIGYSDITILLAHIYTNYQVAGMHAPMVSAFNDGGATSEYVLSLKNLLSGGKANYTCPPHAYNKKGKAEGVLVGGNLSLVAHLTGTSSDIKTKGRILFLEDVTEYLYNIDRMFWHLKRNGKLDKLEGLIIGGFTEMQDTARPYGKEVHDIIHEIVKDYDYPVCFGFPVSHAPENYALKTGVKHRLIISGEGVTLKELDG